MGSQSNQVHLVTDSGTSRGGQQAFVQKLSLQVFLGGKNQVFAEPAKS